MPIRPAIPVRADSTWAERLTEPGWLLLPLRAFLGITFCFAGLQKLANPAYLDPNSPTSIAAQLRLLQHSSPIGGLLSLSEHAPTLIGLAIAIGELAVGVGTLLGLYSRIAALGGLLLSLSFFLTVSWNTTPFYYGSDIVFVFAWLTMFAVGTGDVLSLQAWIRSRARQSLGVRPGHPPPPRVAAEVDRRTVLWTSAWAAVVAGAAAVTAGLTALIGRAAQSPQPNRVAGAPSRSPSPRSQAPTPTRPTRTRSTARGTPIGSVGAVPVGQARSFTDPATGYPAWLVHPSGNTFVAFSAVCTHAGCPVQYDPSTVQFVCPCHGGVYDARTGSVRSGPPPAPLQRIPVTVANGQLLVDT